MKTKSERSFIYCSFYANKKRLGGAYVPEGSTGLERKVIARKQGIMNYNAIVFRYNKNLCLRFKKRSNYLQIKTFVIPEWIRLN